MKTIDVRAGDQSEHLDLIHFPDGQPHVSLKCIRTGDAVRVILSIQSPQDLMKLLLISSAIDGACATKYQLIITYLMGARFDRKTKMAESFDLKVVASVINSCGFMNVGILDPHSEVSLALIENSRSISTQFLVEKYRKADAVLICPDAGAAKKSGKYLNWNKNLTSEVYCVKHRNPENGKIQLTVLNPDACKDRNCVVIDDICDGGATFRAIAGQIQPKHLTLMVTHGIFSKGTRELGLLFDDIITTDSYLRTGMPSYVKVHQFQPTEFIKYEH